MRSTESAAVTRHDATVTWNLQSLLIPTMDAVNDPPTQLPWLEIFIFVLSVVFLYTALRIIVFDDDRKSFVSFQVPVPEQCSPEWKGEVLKEPTIKVPSPLMRSQVSL